MPNPTGGLSVTSAHAAQCALADPDASYCASAKIVRMGKNCQRWKNDVCLGIGSTSTASFIMAQGCDVCKSGYALTGTTINYAGCQVPVETCEACSKTCSNCTSDTDFSAAATGYMKKVTRTCNTCTGTCTATTQYQCAANYYGSSTNGTSGCSPCPNSGKSPAGSTAATGCYITSGTDTSGAFNFDGTQCYYK